MARMIPSPMRDDVKSPAERRLYGLFSAQLPEEWTIFHGVPWQARNPRSGARDGETDFVIAHPHYGILVVEVKGGIIRYDGVTGQWYSNNHGIKDPFAQVRDSKYNLLSVLKEQPYWHSHQITIGHAVAFPDVDVTQHMLKPDAPRNIILDKSHTKDLTTWVTSIFHYWRGQEPWSELPGHIGIREVENVLSSSITLRPLLSSEIVEEEQELLQATKEQFYLLDFIAHHRRAALSGCAESGKTLLAVEKATRLHQQGFSVLLTCFNYKLGAFLRENLAPYPGIYVNHFHGLCSDLALKAKLLPRSEYGVKTESYYNETLPSLLVEAIDHLDSRFDAIIVDEGQDFREDWELSLQYLLQDPDNGVMYIFYDDNQNLYQPGQRIPLEKAPFPLTKNCRNTQLIHAFTQKFYRSDHVIAAIGPQGRAIEIEYYDTPDRLKTLLRRHLHHLIIEEKVSSQDIVVLTPKAEHKSHLWKMGFLGNFHLINQSSVASGEVFCTTIHQFKGLESPVVILAEMESEYAPDMEKLLYVGASRASSHLILLAHNTFSL